MYRIEEATAGNLTEESSRPMSTTTPSTVKLVDTLKSATIIPAFTDNVRLGKQKPSNLTNLYIELNAIIAKENPPT